MAANWDLLGHQWAVQLLVGQLAAKRLRHAYLFTGPAGVGKRTLALRLAQALNCTNPPALGEFCGACRACKGFSRMQHPDLLLLELQEGDREIKVAAVRELSRQLSRTPLEARFQIALLRDFQQANEEAANALLKTLEEPNPSVLLCITAPDVDSLPETIVSRCEVIRLRPMSIGPLAAELAESLKVDQAHANLLASLSGGLPGAAIRLHGDPGALEQRSQWLADCEQLLPAGRVQRFAFAEKAAKDREKLRSQLLVWLSFWRDVLLRAGGLTADGTGVAALSNPDRAERINSLADSLGLAAVQQGVAALERTLEQLNTNINARLALEVLLLDLPTVNK
ncbi:MAG: DNA polymerase III subunit delta' [Anaerolineales bacterium]